jgi:hypothetical protein
MSEQKTSLQTKVSAEESGSERRAFVRHSTAMEAFCEPIAGEIAAEPEMGWAAKVLNISAGGVALVLQRRFEPGTPLVIELSSNAETQGRTLFASVVHVRSQPRGKWLVGCTFTSPLSDDELETILKD